MITSDTFALLRAARDFPDEDTPRLMLADSIEDNFGGAAAYMRESIAHASGLVRGPRRRKAIARDYIRWLRALLDVPELDNDNFIGGGTWDSFFWRQSAVGNRGCKLFVNRDLPNRLQVDLPLLMDRTADLFRFPLTECSTRDRSPYRDDVDGVYYGWVSMPHPSRWSTWEETPSEIPEPLWQYLAPTSDKDQPYHSRGHYLSAIEARSDLNAAVLAFGRATVA